jgi:hypothetical protein
MDKSQVSCTHCGQAYQLDGQQMAKLAGRSITCRKCSKAFVVPEPVGFAVATAEVAAGGLSARALAEPGPQQAAAEMLRKYTPASTEPAGTPLPYRSPSTPDRPGVIELPGAITPEIALLPGEQIIDQFEAGFLDLGPIGYILRHSRRMVLTTHRLVNFDKKLLSNALQIAWLGKVSSATAGQLLSTRALIVGAALILYALWSLFQAMFTSYRGASTGDYIVALLLAGAGILVILLARTKMMLVSADGDKVAIKLTRLKSEESKRFLDGVFARIAAMHGANRG